MTRGRPKNPANVGNRPTTIMVNWDKYNQLRGKGVILSVVVREAIDKKLAEY